MGYNLLLVASKLRRGSTVGKLSQSRSIGPTNAGATTAAMADRGLLIGCMFTDRIGVFSPVIHLSHALDFTWSASSKRPRT